jgi:tetratricopeptide (TPR) repeat protein
LIVMVGSTASWGSQQALERYDRGLSHERSLNIFTALDDFKAAAELDPDNTGILEHYAWLLHTYQFREEAVGAFQQLLQRQPDKKVVYIGLGWNELELGRAARSIEFFDKVYDLTAPRSDVGASYAEIRARSARENKEKILELQRQLAADPANIAAGKELFQTYCYQAEWSNAFQIGARLLEVSRGDLPFRYAYYRGLLWSGRAAEAEAILTSLMVDSPDNAYLHYELGRLLLAGNRLPEAEAALATSLGLYPEALKTRRALGEVLARSGRTGEAVAVATAMLRTGGTSLDAQLALANALRLGARWEEAAVRYRQILNEYPYNVEALSGLAESALRAGDLPGAEAAAASWELANSGDPALGRVRGEIARAGSSITVQADSFANSSDFRRLNAGFTAKFRSWAGFDPRLGYAYSRFRQDGFSEIDRHSFSLEGDLRISPALSVGAELGMNVYDNEQDHLNGKITLRADPFRGSHLSLTYSHLDIIDTEPLFENPLYNYVASIGAVGLKITTDDLSLYLQQMIGDDLMLWGNFTSGSYSDGNRKLVFVLGADYRLSEEPFLRLRYAYFFLDYQEPAPTYREAGSEVAAYFDPTSFGVHTPGVELGFNLTPRLGLSIADDVSYVVTSEKIANSISCALTFRFTKVDALRLDFRSIADVYRQEDDDRFSAEHFMASFSHRF